MPLSINTSYQLQTPAHSGQSTKKHAIVVRLSKQALDALATSFQGGNTSVELDFGRAPALHIAGSVFPVSRQPDESHDIYLRAPTSAKPNPPLRLHASVAGKFTVLEKEIGEDLTEKIRKSTKEAADQRSDRRTILIDPLKEPPTTTKKRKEPTNMFRKPQRQSMPPSKPLPPVPSPEQVSGVLKRSLIHLVAIEAPTTERAVKAVVRDTSSAAKYQSVLNCLNQIADPTEGPGSSNSSNNTRWRLKPEYWLEVRPYEFNGLDEPVRTNLARQGRKACSIMRIPESDPLWDNFKFRAPTAPAPGLRSSSHSHAVSSPTGVSEPSTRNAVMTKDMRDQKSKQGPLKDMESHQVSGQYKTQANGPPSDSKTPIPKDSAVSLHARGDSSKAMAARSRIAKGGQAPLDEKVQGEQRPHPKPRLHSDITSNAPSKGSSGPTSMLKRKKAAREDDDKGAREDDDKGDRREGVRVPVKKIKLEQEYAPRTSTSTTKRPDHAPTGSKVDKAFVKREPSPSPAPSFTSRVSSASKTSKPAKIKGASSTASRVRLRDRNNIYTSSEDEGELPQKRIYVDIAPSTTNSILPSSQDMLLSRVVLASRGDDGRNDLRNRYNLLYKEYLAIFHKVFIQRGLIEQRLEKFDQGGGASEVEDDAEMLDAEALTTLSNDLHRYKSELEDIRRSYEDSS